MNLFNELPLSTVLLGNLKKKGYAVPTPVQSKAIPPALAGHDIVATAQTGTGKTLAFCLPLVETLLRQPAPAGKAVGPRALILSPTRELAIQIAREFEEIAIGTGFRAATVVGGMAEGAQLNALRRGAQVVIATPGRLCDFLDRKLVNLSQVSHVILDEGDRMLDMGFLPALHQILGQIPKKRQTLFFSATIEPSASKLIAQHLTDPVRIALGPTTKPTENVDLHFYEIEHDRKVELLHHMLGREQGSFLVFARTRHGVEKLTKRLARVGVKATSIHGDRTQGQRNRALAGFQQGDYRVLVATDVAARGIHVDGISHVVNFDLPMVPEDFIHRVGRTGRAGARGVAHTFGTRQERNEVRRIERALNVQLSRQQLPVIDPMPEPLPQFADRPIVPPAPPQGARKFAKSGPPSWSNGGRRPEGGRKAGSGSFGGARKFRGASSGPRSNAR
ncbi:MAG TPA: DEAD/DEAH box helicase [Bryobacteraceae bacterium]|nr:DEAD/DEAH box helicase [Bryobacteraceae bacterium]